MFVAATNRADLLDAALMRAGRFDRKIRILNPDEQGRTEILQVGHCFLVAQWGVSPYLCWRGRLLGRILDPNEQGYTETLQAARPLQQAQVLGETHRHKLAANTRTTPAPLVLCLRRSTPAGTSWLPVWTFTS